ncbi:MAG: hypothetical protein NZM31_14230 [Gemmatales bacterium]|nr:hypothetical protein [Gemmatales bacterium]MDW8388153.1 hypothetical protein [Gemmatales bacterium]
MRRFPYFLWAAFGLLGVFSSTLSAAENAPPSTSEMRRQGAALVQAAMQEAREALARGDSLAAVQVLEAQLARIQGNAVFLRLLEDAYRRCVADLEAQGKREAAQIYRQRLAILSPPGEGSKDPASGQRNSSPADGSSRLIVRGTSGEDKVNDSLVLATASGKQALEQAEQAFRAGRFQQAGRLYAQAYEQERSLPQPCRERWAYCKLHWVTEQINQADRQKPDWLLLETEVRTALSLAPRLEYGQTLLQRIEQCHRSATTVARSRFTVRHSRETVNGWQQSESPNFRVFHTDPTMAEQVLHVAEQTRSAVLRKWLGEENPEDWKVPCDIYLHANAQAYAHATGTPPESPGHSSIGAERQDASRIHSRRIDLRLDEPNLLRAVLPHETTHVTLAGLFGPKPLPRWADEGMAVLSEPYERIQRHLRPLWENPDDERRFSAAELMAQEEYPGPAQMAYFYGQSATLVQYLTELKGPLVFTDFLRTAQRIGYAAALKSHYQLDFPELERRWREYVYVQKVPGLNLALRR